MSFLSPFHNLAPAISLSGQPETVDKDFPPEVPFPMITIFFTCGNQVAKLGQCKDEQTRKFITGCNLNPQSISGEDFSFENNNLNENDVLIIQGSLPR